MSSEAIRRARRRHRRHRPAYDSPDYRSTALRAPKQPLVILPERLRRRCQSRSTATARSPRPTPTSPASTTASRWASGSSSPAASWGRTARPVPNTLIEIWQANAAGRYRHADDQHPAPLDPNFTGAGRCLTDAEGSYRFVSIKPGAYPWRNHDNAWRPAHIHLSVFGRLLSERLVTQMYFPGDPLFDADPIFQSVRDPAARQRMISSFDWDQHVAGVGARLSLRHRARRPACDPGGPGLSAGPTPSQTVGPFFSLGLTQRVENDLAPDDAAGAVWIRGRVLDGAGRPRARRDGGGLGRRPLGPLGHRRRTAATACVCRRRRPWRRPGCARSPAGVRTRAAEAGADPAVLPRPGPSERRRPRAGRSRRRRARRV